MGMQHMWETIRTAKPTKRDTTCMQYYRQNKREISPEIKRAQKQKKKKYERSEKHAPKLQHNQQKLKKRKAKQTI